MITIRTLRIVRWTALGLIVLFAAGIAFIKFGPATYRQASTNDAPASTVAIPDGVPIGGPFKLIDNKGHAATDSDYRDRWMLILFGYTNCPDECPLTLQKMANALDALGPLADRIEPLFITVDPAHDTTSRLSDYLANFDTRMVGLTGSDEEIAAATKAYRVYYSPAEHEQSGADLVSHSTFLYLVNPRGKLDALFSQDDADVLAATLRARLSSENQTGLFNALFFGGVGRVSPKCHTPMRTAL
jgi:cytochrome oxidase Cu insertion factor (SCO1/SenC/PrrC family)